MKLDKDHTGSGTLATDFYRDGVGLAAANVLLTGKSARCVVGDHTGSETCAEVIVRLANSSTKVSGSDASVNDSINRAVDNLRAGIGVHKVAANHSGGNTCTAVIAAAV